MTHGILIPNAIAATNIDSWNRNVISASAIDNGFVFEMSSRYTTGSLAEVSAVIQPSSASPTNMWMAYSSDELVLTDSKYKGLDPDPRNFYVPANTVFSAYRLERGDIITLTDDNIDGSYSAGSTVYLNSQADSFKLKWGTAQITGRTCYKLIGKTYISLATGAIDDQRIDAYQFECLVA